MVDADGPLPQEFRLARSRIMYIESGAGGLEGPAVIGRVYFPKPGRTLYCRGRRFRSLKGRGFNASWFDCKTGEPCWIPGPRRDRNDRLYGSQSGAAVDEDVREDCAALVSGRG